MTDEAKLVLAVDSTQPKQAATTLDELAAAGARAEASTDKLNKAAKTGVDTTMAFQKAWFDGKNTIDNSTLSIIRASDETQKLIDRYDPLGAKLRNLEKDFKALSDAARTGLVPDSANGSVDQAYVRINSEIAKTKALMGEVGDAGAKGFKAAEEAANKSMFATVSAKRELIVLAHEAMTGNFSRMPGSMLVLAEYTHFTSTMFNALTLSVAGVTVGLVATFAAMIKGAHEQKGFNDALIMSGNYAGATGDKLNEMAHKATAAGGSLNTAKESVEGLAASGKYTSDQIQAIASSVVLMEAAVEKSTKKTIKQFESLAIESTGHTSLAADVISRAVVKLDDEYHFLTLSVYNNIRALELEGQQKEASALATNEFAKATHDRAKDIMDNLGDVARAWNVVKESVNGAIDAIGNVGKRRTAASDVATAQANIAALSGADDPYGLTVGMAGKDRMIAEAKEALIDATKRLIRENDNALAQGEQAKIQSAAIHAAQQLDLQMKSLQKKSQGELTTAMQEYHQRIEVIRAADANDSRVSAQAIIDGEAAITRAYAEKTKAGVDSYGAISASIARAREQVELSLDQDGKLAASDRFRISTLSEIDEALRKGTVTMQRANELSKEMQDTQSLMRNREKLIQQLKDEADAVKELETNIRSLYNAGMKEVEATEKQIEKLEAHNSEIGKSKEQINQIRAARQEQSAVDDEVYAGLLREAALFAGDYHDAYLGYAKDLETIAANKRKIAQLDRDGALLEKGASLAKEQAAEWAKNWKEINKLGQDVFVEWGMSGENMAKKIGDMLKKALLSAIYDATLKPLVFQVYSSIMGGPPDGTKGVQGLMGQGSSILNTASNLNSLYGAGLRSLYGGTAGASTASLGYANAVGIGGGDSLGALITANGGWNGVAVGTTTASTVGGTGAVVGGIETGGSLGIGSGTALGGGGSASGGSGLFSSLGSMGPYGWAAIAAIAAIASIAGGPQITEYGSGLTGSLGAKTELNNRRDFKEDHHGIFGIGSFTTKNSEYSPADDKTTAYFNARVEAVGKATSTYATALGLDAKKIEGYSQAIDITFTGLDAAGIQDLLNKTIGDFENGLVTSAYGDELKGLEKARETSSQTLVRLATNMSLVNQGLEMLGFSMLPVGMGSAKIAAGLTDAFGGTGNMQKVVGSYFETMYSEGERAAFSAEALKNQFTALGVEMPTTEAGFRSLVGGMDISTESGRQLAAAVMSLAPAFNQAAASAQAAAANMLSALQNYGTSDEVKAFQVNQIGDALRAAGIDVDNTTIAGGTREQYRAAYESFAAQGNVRATDALMAQQQAFANLTKAATGATAAIGGSSGGGGGGGGGGGSSTNTLVGALQGLTDAIFEEVSRIKGLIAGDSMLGYVEAQAKFALGTSMARAGDQEAIKALPGLSQNMLRLAEINEASLVDLNYVRATTANSLQVTGTQLANQYGLTIPQFASGTDYVPQDMLAMIHEGERITPKGFNPTANETGNTEMLQVLWTIRGDMRDAVALLQSIDRNMKRSADIIEKSDTIGPAPARVVA